MILRPPAIAFDESKGTLDIRQFHTRWRLGIKGDSWIMAKTGSSIRADFMNDGTLIRRLRSFDAHIPS